MDHIFRFFRFRIHLLPLPLYQSSVLPKPPDLRHLLAAVCTLATVLQGEGVWAQAFTFEFIGQELTAVDYADAEWGDIDRDGDLDLVVTGLTQGQFAAPSTFVYFNFGQTGSVDAKGDSVWSQVYTALGQGLLPVWLSAASWVDVNNDGVLDVLVAGARNLGRPFNPTTRLYRLAGSRFEEIPSNLPGVYGATIDWGDFDNDGRIDLLVTGETDAGRLTGLFRNLGDGMFEEVNAGLLDVSIGDAKFADFDGDGDLDIALTGDTGAGFVTSLFRNDGGVFGEVPFAFPPLAFSSLDWGDYDNDGDPDILLAGGTLSPLILDGQAYVFRNDGDGVFTDIGADIDGMFYGAARWGDYDNDGLLDILLSGASNLQDQRLGRLYRNEGGTFRLAINLSGLLFSEAALGDYDGDGDLDILQVGDGVTNQFRNDHLRVNERPEAPTGTGATTSAGAVVLSWSAAFDENTPPAGLSYNIRVGSAPGAVDIVNPLSIVSTGRRLVSRVGNVGQNTSWTVSNLASGTYFWAVQALDNAQNGSPFSEEGSFTIVEGGGIATGAESDGIAATFEVAATYPNPFAGETTVEFTVAEASVIHVDVFNTLGERVRSLASGPALGGVIRIVWDGRGDNGSDVGAGLYVVRLDDGRRLRSLKVVKVHP